jgi:hypothetical protein
MNILKMLLPFLYKVVRGIGTTVLTPMLEKSAVKILGLESPLVVSMSRLIAVGFAAVMLKHFWQSGINGWPDATLGIATVLALPVMNAIQRANPDEVVALTRVLIARMSTPQPSKFDDHRSD